MSKRSGDQLLSGSFCALNGALMRAETVGAESYVNWLSAAARRFRTVISPLQQEISQALRLMALLSILVGGLTQLSASLYVVPIQPHLQALAVIAGVVPTGLIQSLMLAYMLAAVKIARRGVLVQQANAVELLSCVDVLCLDKTGTLTTNRLQVHAVREYAPEAKRRLGDFASSTRVKNRTIEAISAAIPGQCISTVADMPFSSEWKWSGLSFQDPQSTGTLVLGAPEIIAPHLHDSPDVSCVREWSEQGLRVVMFAHAPGSVALTCSPARTEPPDGLTLLAVIAIMDELRPNVRETLSQFICAGVQIKVISGDSPETVTAVVRQLGLEVEEPPLSGSDLDTMDEIELAQATRRHTVFARVKPEQKALLVQALKSEGHYVAMIGDGVNDILSLKKANLGIAMEHGSSAARSVADIVLLNNSFAGLPAAMLEGRRIVNSMQSILATYMNRGLYTVLLIVAAAYLGVGFPFGPKQVSLISILTVGMPAFFLILWAHPGAATHAENRWIKSLMLPATLTFTLIGLTVYTVAFVTTQEAIRQIAPPGLSIADFIRWARIPIQGVPYMAHVDATIIVARAALTHFSVFSGLFLLLFVRPPTSFFAVVGSEQPEPRDWRPCLLALCIGIVYTITLTMEPTRRLMQFPEHTVRQLSLAIPLACVWMLLFRGAVKYRLLERLRVHG